MLRPFDMQSISGTIALVGTLAYVLSFAVGVGPVPGILVSEINAAAIRGKMHRQLCIAACGHHFSGAHTSSSRARLALQCFIYKQSTGVGFPERQTVLTLHASPAACLPAKRGNVLPFLHVPSASAMLAVLQNACKHFFNAIMQGRRWRSPW